MHDQDYYNDLTLMLCWLSADYKEHCNSRIIHQLSETTLQIDKDLSERKGDKQSSMLHSKFVLFM